MSRRPNELTICDFRGFPGPAPFKLELKGKNLLIYGENGAGKSSIYHALNEFFSLEDNTTAGKRDRLSDLKNRFSKEPFGNCFVEVKFDEGSEAKWTEVSHPAVSPNTQGDKQVVQGALRKAMLDYRSLLDTNYKHGSGEVNLFDVFIETLLRDYPATKAGSSTQTVHEIWQEIEAIMALDRISPGKGKERDSAIDAINDAILSAIDELLPAPPSTDVGPINQILQDLGWKDVKVTLLAFSKFRFNGKNPKDLRGFIGNVITPSIERFDEKFERPQNYLNEARLSALGLAIYLAARKVNTRFMPADAPRLLVLDDVLIGLDQSNRLPVLELIFSKFSDWQVVLLTHDRVWYDMARASIKEKEATKILASNSWEFVEIRSPDDDPRAMPQSITHGDGAATLALAHSKAFLAQGHLSAAANYARTALEIALHYLCDKKSVKVRYKQDRRKQTSEELLSAAKEWAKNGGSNSKFFAALENVEMFKSIVLNPNSHAGAPNITKHEIAGAIAAVDAIVLATKVT
jgi:energy-coupling factor transporter ATP-binding protein EcfA2